MLGTIHSYSSSELHFRQASANFYIKHYHCYTDHGFAHVAIQHSLYATANNHCDPNISLNADNHFLRFLSFRKVSSFTKKAVKSLISHGFTAWYDGETDGYSITVGFSFSIFCFFNSIDECTYLFNVMFTLECPRISLRLLISNPSSTHLVAKVCRNAW